MGHLNLLRKFHARQARSAKVDDAAGHAPLVQLELAEVGSGGHLAAVDIGSVPVDGEFTLGHRGIVQGHQFLTVDVVNLDGGTGAAAFPGDGRLVIQILGNAFAIHPHKGLPHRCGNLELDLDGLAEGIGPAFQKVTLLPASGKIVFL